MLLFGVILVLQVTRH